MRTSSSVASLTEVRHEPTRRQTPSASRRQYSNRLRGRLPPAPTMGKEAVSVESPHTPARPSPPRARHPKLRRALVRLRGVDLATPCQEPAPPELHKAIEE